MSDKEFEALMVKHGWQPIRDVFGNIVEYRRGKASISGPQITAWKRLGKTPPPW